MTMITKVLIANRGEIACRIARTCHAIGLPVSTVHSEADRRSVHVRMIGESVEIGPAAAAGSYLNVEAIIRAAQITGADAVHPGIGFLSEAPEFCEAVEAAGLIFVGPRSETLRSFGDKAEAKKAAIRADVPVIQGSEHSFADAAEIEDYLGTLRLPVVLKAVAGGGGRGVRILRSLEGAREAIESAMREARASFGRADLLVERFIERARHVEVQIAGDGRGNVIHLFERECSLQRRFQKVLEEAPAHGLDSKTRNALISHAVRLGASVGYRNLGTIEFLVTPDEHFFLECNPRLQVEHTVTEEVTGVDLVELQLHVAEHASLPLSQDAVSIKGAAVQARVNAEQPNAGFIPSTGRLLACDFPGNGVRVETGVEKDSVITPYYDSMLAKLIVHRHERADALESLRGAIEQTTILGIQTNLDFLAKLLREPEVRAGTADNQFIDQEFSKKYRSSAPSKELFAAAARLLIEEQEAAFPGVWSCTGSLSGWRLGDGIDLPTHTPAVLLTCEGQERRIAFGPKKDKDGGMRISVDEETVEVKASPLGDGRFEIGVGLVSWTVRASRSPEFVEIAGAFGVFRFDVAPFLALQAQGTAVNGQVLAPMLGTVTKVNVAVGDRVAANEVVVVLESMKMELNLASPCDGIVVGVSCSVGATIERYSLLVEIDAGVPTPGESDERSAKVSHIPRRRPARRLSN